ncbi:MAG: nucleotidyltransferase domain-containing protein, partial [Methyloprofundus sp.]|nr:nucleotidyltransferase domain-containing protein [Methyloprofundus sp.]
SPWLAAIESYYLNSPHLLKGIWMRLSNRLKKLLINCILESYGEVDVYLFGSRTDNSKKGGDIDLAVDVDLTREEFKQQKIKFIMTMIKQGLELKVDIVPYKSHDKLLTEEIFKSAVKIN